MELLDSTANCGHAMVSPSAAMVPVNAAGIKCLRNPAEWSGVLGGEG